MRLPPFLFVLIPLYIAGCAGSMPVTADKFRQAVPGTAMTTKETFEVNRPYDQVIGTFRRKAVQCLDVTVQTTTQVDGGYREVVSNWNPTLIAGGEKTELHIQRVYEQGAARARGEPGQGHFVMVVDITPASIYKTRIDIYRSAQGVDTVLKAVNNWATGKDIGCPDMTKN
jgi:hypothetical protein